MFSPSPHRSLRVEVQLTLHAETRQAYRPVCRTERGIAYVFRAFREVRQYQSSVAADRSGKRVHVRDVEVFLLERLDGRVELSMFRLTGHRAYSSAR